MPNVHKIVKEIEFSDFKHNIQVLKREFAKEDGMSCYLFGMGKQSKSVYVALSKADGVNVIWYGSVLPNYLSFLNLISANYSGLIKIEDYQLLPSLSEQLLKMSMIGVFYFESTLEADFEEYIVKYRSLKRAEPFILNQRNFMFYQVDADNMESSTGIYEIIESGKDNEIWKKMK